MYALDEGSQRVPFIDGAHLHMAEEFRGADSKFYRLGPQGSDEHRSGGCITAIELLLDLTAFRVGESAVFDARDGGGDEEKQEQEWEEDSGGGHG